MGRKQMMYIGKSIEVYSTIHGLIHVITQYIDMTDGLREKNKELYILKLDITKEYVEHNREDIFFITTT